MWWIGSVAGLFIAIALLGFCCFAKALPLANISSVHSGYWHINIGSRMNGYCCLFFSTLSVLSLTTVHAKWEFNAIVNLSRIIVLGQNLSPPPPSKWHLWIKGTVSPLHTNLQVVNFQRYERSSGSSKEPEPVPSTSGMSEIAACPPSPIADYPSALPSPTSSPSSIQ